METNFGALIFLVTSLVPALAAQAPQPALAEKEVVRLVRHSKKDLQSVVSTVAARGVDFDLDLRIEKELRKAGANDDVLEAIWKAGPAGRSQKALLTTATGAGIEATPEEAQAFQNVENETDAARRSQMASDFQKSYPNSRLLSYIYAQEAKTYEKRGDVEKVIEYGEKSLKVDPDNLFSLIQVSITLAQPGMMKGTEAEKAKRLSEAENCANRALKLIEQVKKQSAETDEQFQTRKGTMSADVHFTLGMVHLLRDEYPMAVEEYKKAISSTASPTAQLYFRLAEAYEMENKRAEAIEAFTRASELGRGTMVETSALERRQQLEKKK